MSKEVIMSSIPVFDELQELSNERMGYVSRNNDSLSPILDEYGQELLEGELNKIGATTPFILKTRIVPKS
jgi:hypothetical protein